jgi:two-component system cell cycle response regulator
MAVFDDYPPSNSDSSNPDSNDMTGTDSTKVLSADQATLKSELATAKEQEACLIIIRGTPQGHRFFLTQNEMTLGRDPSADITIIDQSISRKHAKITKTPEGKIAITDLGSANGSLINDKKLAANETRVLAKEDMITLGNTIMKFLPQGELETLYLGNLSSAAHTDALTKLFNKRYLMEILEVEFKRAKSLHTDFSVLFFDLDHFKKVNDNFGHDAGDLVLREFSDLVRTNHIRPKDVFARYGGEEFVLLLANTNAADAKDIAERIRVAIETHAFIYNGKRMPVTSSMGIAELTTGIESAQTLLKHADQALYAAKNSGRNRVVVADAP